MLRKILICAFMSVTLLIAACGEEKVVGTPDKAILAYCETITMGESPDLEAAGFSADDNKNLRKVAINVFAETFGGIVPLNEESTDELAKIFYANSKAKMTFQTKIKTEYRDQPVVELTTTPLDIAKPSGALNDEFIALIGMVGKLKSDGATDEQLKENPEVQKLAVTAFGKYLAEIPVQAEKTFEVTCKKVKGADGKVHWAPSDGNALMNFITGKS